MDNGHRNAIFSGNPDMENSLNEENWQRSLEISAPAGMPTIEKIATPEQEIATTEDVGLYSAENITTPDTQTTESLQELGQITPIETTHTNQVGPVAGVSQKYNPINIKTTGDRLEKSTIPEIDNIINELNQTGNLNNFYDEIRGTDAKPGMMEINLENSYGRKLGEREAS